jgi:hypothetical protein
MDIEQTKKMNFMIRELTRTGAVRGYEDAMVMAGNVYEEGLPQAQASLVVTEESDRVRDCVDKRIRNHLADLTEQLGVETKANASFREQTLGELKRIWASLEEMKQQAPKPQHRPAEIESTAEVKSVAPAELKPEPKPELRQEEKKQAPQPHPRAGNYNSDDVSLDKFFYFGTGAKK